MKTLIKKINGMVKKNFVKVCNRTVKAYNMYIQVVCFIIFMLFIMLSLPSMMWCSQHEFWAVFTFVMECFAFSIIVDLISDANGNIEE